MGPSRSKPVAGPLVTIGEHRFFKGNQNVWLAVVHRQLAASQSFQPSFQDAQLSHREHLEQLVDLAYWLCIQTVSQEVLNSNSTCCKRIRGGVRQAVCNMWVELFKVILR